MAGKGEGADEGAGEVADEAVAGLLAKIAAEGDQKPPQWPMIHRRQRRQPLRRQKPKPKLARSPGKLCAGLQPRRSRSASGVAEAVAVEVMAMVMAREEMEMMPHARPRITASWAAPDAGGPKKDA